MKTIEDYKDNIIKCLKYIVDRNTNIDIENCSTDYAEVVEMNYYQYPRKSYIVFLNNKYFKIYPFTLIGDALYILKNISDIKYVYNYNKGVDTLFGNVRQVLSKYKMPDYKYVEYLVAQTSLLNKEDVYNFLKGESYTIRFSDHENKHPEFGPVEEVDMNGMVAKNLQKSAMKIFKSKISDIKNDIKKFEIEKFGEQRTFFD